LTIDFLAISNARGKILLGNERGVIGSNNPSQTFGVTSLIPNLQDCINRYIFQKIEIYGQNHPIDHHPKNEEFYPYFWSP